jgi:FkbM family methyltransferase
MGVDISRHPQIYQLVELLRDRGVSTVIDVGANEGQYALKLLEARYRDSIISVEPLRAPFDVLAAKAANNPRWEAVHAALGSEPGILTVHIAGNSQSSSVLPMLDLHEQAASASPYVGTEDVAAVTVDDLLRSRGLDAGRCFLKIDVQGYESAVLDGAAETLPTIAAVELELSLAPLYDGQALMPELVQRMEDHGLVLWSLKPAFADARNGRLLQVDGVFARFGAGVR